MISPLPRFERPRNLYLFLSFFFLLYMLISDHVVKLTFTWGTRDAFFRIRQVHLSEAWTVEKRKCQGRREIGGVLVFWNGNSFYLSRAATELDLSKYSIHSYSTKQVAIVHISSTIHICDFDNSVKRNYSSRKIIKKKIWS